MLLFLKHTFKKSEAIWQHPLHGSLILSMEVSSSPWKSHPLHGSLILSMEVSSSPWKSHPLHGSLILSMEVSSDMLYCVYHTKWCVGQYGCLYTLRSCSSLTNQTRHVRFNFKLMLTIFKLPTCFDLLTGLHQVKYLMYGKSFFIKSCL